MHALIWAIIVIVIIAAVIIAIWAATRGGPVTAPIDERLIVEHGKVRSTSTTQQQSTGITTTIVTFQDGTTMVLHTDADGTTTFTTNNPGVFDSTTIRDLAQSVGAEYHSRLSTHTYGPKAHDDTRREDPDGRFRDDLDRAARTYNIYLPDDLRQFHFGVNRAIEDYVRVGRPYGTLSAFTYRYSKALESAQNNHLRAFVFDLCFFDTPVPQWDTDIAALRQAIQEIGEPNVEEHDRGDHHCFLVDDISLDASMMMLYRAFAMCAKS